MAVQGVHSSLIRCPPSCPPRCTTKHHPLLVAVLNSSADSDTPDAACDALFKTFEQTNGWSLTVPIADPIVAYQMPILHWAFYLGKLSFIQCICDRTLSSLESSSSVDRQTRLRCLYSALVEGNSDGGNTPLHLCCEMIAGNGCDIEPADFHLRCVNALLDFIADRVHSEDSDDVRWTNVLNAQNSLDETPLHIICRNDSLHYLVLRMVSLGADVSLVCSGCTPLGVALNCNNKQIVSVLREVKDAASSIDSNRRLTSDQDSPPVANPNFVGQILSQFGLNTSLADSPTTLRDYLLHCDKTLLLALRSSATAGLQKLRHQKVEVKTRLTANEDSRRCMSRTEQTERFKVRSLLVDLDRLQEEQKKLDRHLETIDVKMTYYSTLTKPDAAITEHSSL